LRQDHHTVSLAAALADLGLRVAVTDTDPQCNATDSFGIDRDQLAADGVFTLADAYIAKRPARELQYHFDNRFGGHLTVVPGHKGIGTVAHRLEAQLQAAIANGEFSDLDADDVKNEHRHRLKVSLDTLRSEKDVVLIDTPPDLGFLMTTALIAADWFIIPVFPSGYDLKGLETLLGNVQKVQQRYNPQLRLLGVLLGNTDARAKLDSDIHAMLVKKFGSEFVFETIIHRSVKHREATVYGQTIFEHAGGQQPAEQYRALAGEVIARLKGVEQTLATSDLMEANRG
jgi:chromosome partitioning protein